MLSSSIDTRGGCIITSSPMTTHPIPESRYWAATWGTPAHSPLCATRSKRGRRKRQSGTRWHQRGGTYVIWFWTLLASPLASLMAPIKHCSRADRDQVWLELISSELARLTFCEMFSR